MEIIKTNQLTAVDVDDTLLIHDPNPADKSKCVMVDGICFIPHQRHIEQIKAHKARGHTILVWSQGGEEWAEKAVKILNLEQYVDYVMDKPYWIYDDLDPHHWLTRIYYKPDDMEVGRDHERSDPIEGKDNDDG